MLGGSGSLDVLYNDWPMWKKPAYFDIWCATTMGYHLEAFFFQLSGNKRNDFVEMMLHHVVTVSLIVFTIMVNTTDGGMIVLFVHHIGDVFISVARILVDVHTKSSVVAFLTMMVVWAYTRLYAYPFVVYRSYDYDF